MTAPILTPDDVPSYLAARGVLAAGERADVRELDGGVSCAAYAVTDGARDLVVKQALPRLRVQTEWLADPQRAMAEGAALRLAGELLPGAVPEVVDLDPGALALTMRHAPADWTPWREQLLHGTPDPRVAAEVGRLLGILHRRTHGADEVARAFDRPEAFEQLRLRPFYATVARRDPRVRAAVSACEAALRYHRRCLVHGDYSPKNVLAGPGGLWILDWEVAHWGDPAFDVAFMLHHLALKTVHRPGVHAVLYDCADAFVGAYRAEAPALMPAFDYVVCQVACLLLGRVDGQSPAPYLRPAEQDRTRGIARELLERPCADVDALWERLAP